LFVFSKRLFEITIVCAGLATASYITILLI